MLLVAYKEYNMWLELFCKANIFFLEIRHEIIDSTFLPEFINLKLKISLKAQNKLLQNIHSAQMHISIS